MSGGNTGFEHAYELFIQFHRCHRKGESKDRLTAGLGHAEKIFLSNVWWPAFGNFNELHPEYEVKDFKDGVRYLDFAYFKRDVSLKLCIEIDGFGTHWRDWEDGNLPIS
ncbi:hypothetical protein [Paenibacillus sp. sptzw28]|uniref:hypothetical protein n=1 Tax=Paenibacillus sp. sptzw28 TaxID=715179 RepID=UPI002163320F|nr:hypothetical protein [Paenibacillus sp. sptzw28]